MILKFLVILSVIKISFLPLKFQDPPQQIVAAFQAKYGSVVPVWEKATGMHLAAFAQNGQQFKAVFKDDASFIRLDKLISFNQLPAAIQTDVNQRFGGSSNVVEVASFSDDSGNTCYRIRYQKGQSKVDVMYNSQNVIFQRAILE